MKMEETVVTDVNFSGTFEIVKLPDGFNVDENLILVSDSAYYLKDESSSIENFNVDINIVFTNKNEE